MGEACCGTHKTKKTQLPAPTPTLTWRLLPNANSTDVPSSSISSSPTSRMMYRRRCVRTMFFNGYLQAATQSTWQSG